MSCRYVLQGWQPDVVQHDDVHVVELAFDSSMLAESPTRRLSVPRRTHFARRVYSSIVLWGRR